MLLAWPTYVSMYVLYESFHLLYENTAFLLVFCFIYRSRSQPVFGKKKLECMLSYERKTYIIIDVFTEHTRDSSEKSDQNEERYI